MSEHDLSEHAPSEQGPASPNPRKILPEDPLAQQAETWTHKRHGPACRRCHVQLERGHRFYREARGRVIHYDCRAAEDYDHSLLGF